MFKNILLATDGSDHSKRAIEQAIQMTAPYKDQVTLELVYSVDGDTSKEDILKHGDSSTAAVKRKERFFEVIQEIEASGVKTGITILHGDPAETIIEYANERNYDCVVVGSRGRNKLQTLILGSVSHKLMKYIKCPVMVVK
ncbi:universal stress protein [Halobacillus sp. A5]|uniref:universal stress protein n=1 Tax=Halobacillus sp. A5 TaxID=2880263 RepID=UPI0020A62368|nr:universal stress protein [Halobacillus sp. A5]MCP3029428.1 universal stress protein [Halobacillus sp. A5]